MNIANLLLLVIAISGSESSSKSDDRCPTVNALDLSKKRVYASSTCGDSNSSSQYCYGSSSTIQCSTCENEDEVNVRNAVDHNPMTHWISRPGLEAVNLTVDLLQVCVHTYILPLYRHVERERERERESQGCWSPQKYFLATNTYYTVCIDNGTIKLLCYQIVAMYRHWLCPVTTNIFF